MIALPPEAGAVPGALRGLILHTIGALVPNMRSNGVGSDMKRIGQPLA